ncbi:MAG: metal-dependent phosphohydrolase, partial [Trebonia sp.]
MGKFRWGARVYICAVVIAAVVVVILGPLHGINWDQVAALGLLLIVCESTATVLKSRSLAWSAASISSLAAVVLTGPVGGALVGCCLLLSLRRGPSLAQRLFNTGMFALSAYLSGRAYLLLGGHVGTPQASSFPGIIGPFAGSDLVHVIINFSLVRGVLWLTREPSSGSRVGLDLKLLLTDLGYGAFGLLTASLWQVLGPFAPVLVLIPLLVARWAVAQFAAQQRAYEATVSALCQAVETKD